MVLNCTQRFVEGHTTTQGNPSICLGARTLSRDERVHEARGHQAKECKPNSDFLINFARKYFVAPHNLDSTTTKKQTTKPFSSTMPTLPVQALEHQFSSLSTAEQPEEKDVVVVAAPAIVSPTKSEAEHSFAASDASSDASPADVQDDARMLLAKTEHKLMEEQGMLADEPLLKSNPHRFVIFPIQDNDVSSVGQQSQT